MDGSDGINCAVRRDMPLTVDSGRPNKEYDSCCLLTHTAICYVRKMEVMLPVSARGPS